MSDDILKIEKEVVGKRTFFQRIFEVKNFLFAAIGTFILLAFLTRNTPYFTFDLVITRSIQQIDNPVFNFVMLAFTFMGNSLPATISTILISGVLFTLKKPVAATVTLISTAGASLIGIIIKNIVARPRPDSTLIRQLGHFFKPDSFPSGHVLHYMGLYGFLFVFIYIKFKKSFVRTCLLIVNLILLIGIGVSRIDVGAHWFSDVLGSYLIGFIWIYYMTSIYNKYERKTPVKKQ